MYLEDPKLVIKVILKFSMLCIFIIDQFYIPTKCTYYIKYMYLYIYVLVKSICINNILCAFSWNKEEVISHKNVYYTNS